MEEDKRDDVDTKRNDAAAEHGTLETGSGDKDNRARETGERRREYSHSREGYYGYAGRYP